MTVSRSAAWRVNAASTTDLPFGLNFSILALLSSDDGVRRMSPLSSNRSTAAVIEPSASGTLDWISVIESGPLCKSASSAAKSVRPNPLSLMLRSAMWLKAWWHLDNTSQRRGASVGVFPLKITWRVMARLVRLFVIA